MQARDKGIRALTRLYGAWSKSNAPTASSSLRSPSICFSCQRSLQRRHYASAAAAAEPVDEHDPSQQPPPSPSPDDPPVPRPAYQLHAGVVLSRPPVITRDLTPFEKAFFLYQRRLNERLALPFTRYFYYQKGTPADREWKRKYKERQTPARDIGLYRAYGAEGWNDELLVGAPESEPAHQVGALLQDAMPPTKEEAEAGAPPVGESNDVAVGNVGPGEEAAKRVEVERPMPRTTEADAAGDVKSLDRALQRTLYLLVRNPSGRWTFPSARLVGRESLRQAAERVLTQSAGVNMNTWFVGNAPAGHYAFDFPKIVDNAELGTKELGEKVFFMKSRIMSGQADLKENSFGLEDFKWLAKEEIKEHVTLKYWSMVRDMLHER